LHRRWIHAISRSRRWGAPAVDLISLAVALAAFAAILVAIELLERV
jgi:hypothetical protein